MYKRFISGVLALAITIGAVALPVSADTVSAKNKSVTAYTYTITPILSPFNEYFFVKTDNPDPTSFRFADKSSVYDEASCISLDWDDWDEKVNLYADINYENKQTGRVNGGYIFKSFDTDGGEIVLQSRDDSEYSWYANWSDTNEKLKLPALKDSTDYLIDTYADKSNFFDNMDAVQHGFSSVCLYSGSYIRGELYKAGSYWSLSTSPHEDQLFYIQSPYTRKDNKSLFANVIYPFRYDSLGFPSVMGKVAKRLDDSSSYVWNSYWHYLIDVTYDGQTKSYGGAGEGKGQGISEDKIKQYFTFGANGTKITLENARQLLNDYSAIEMEDDVPRENVLTWESVYDKVGSGAWLRLIGIYGIFGSTSTGYTYLYQNGDGTNFSTESAGNNGAEIYWGGDLGYASDAWVDGRYINECECFVPGEKFEDHPTSDILLSNAVIPQITYDGEYQYNSNIGKYEYVYTNIQVTEKAKTAEFNYSEDDDLWIVNFKAFDDDCAQYHQLAEFVEDGLIDEKYLDMVTLTPDEVKALEVDRNTDAVPDDYYFYDGTVEPGTSLKNHKHSYTAETTVKPTCTTGGYTLYKCSICGNEYKGAETAPTGHKYTSTVIKPTCTVGGCTLHKCSVCGNEYKDSITEPTGHTESGWIIDKPAGVGTTGSKHTECTVCKKVIKTETIPALAAVKLSSCTIGGISNKAFTGNPLTQSITVKYGSQALTKDKDYTVSYSNNKNVGTAKVTVTGKGSYTGSVTKTFVINPAKQTIQKLETRYKGFYIDWAQKGSATGYEIQYATNSGFTGAQTKKLTANRPDTCTISGLTADKTYYVRVRSYTVTGGKTYYGAWSDKKSIKTARYNFASAKVSGISTKAYTGKAIAQNITVKYGSKTLKNGTDYTVKYSNNKKVGTATVTITGKGSYGGIITKTFKINPAKQEIQKLTAKSKAFYIDWAQKGSATGYELQYSTGSKFTSPKTVKVTNNKTDTKTVSKLSGNKKYYVRVRSYTVVNGTKYYGAWSTAKSVATKK